MKKLTSYSKRVKYTYVKTTLVTIFVSLFFLKGYTVFEKTGENYFHVFLNGTEIGTVGEADRAEQLLGEKLGLQEQVEGMQGQLDDSLAEIRRLAHLGKKELDPADYDKFLKGYAKLSTKELEICEALVSGLSTRQCAEQIGCASSTVDTYRKRVYEKTGIHKMRQLQLCVALMQLEQAEQDK